MTPVFNGSTSLRDASGQMIESVAKSVKRKQTVNDAYMEKLFEDMNALYRLDQVGGRGALSVDKSELGELPTASVILLIVLGIIWLLIGTYVLFETIKKKKH